MRKAIRETLRGYYETGVPISLGRTHNSRPATKHPTTRDIAWAAGVYEGEGYCNFTSKRKDCVEAAITQKDRWLPYKFQSFFGGHVSVCKSRGSHGQKPLGGEYHRWRVSGTRARGFLMTMYAYLSPRRQAQVKALGFLRSV